MDQILLVYLGFVSLEESEVVKQFSWNSFVSEVKSKRSNNKYLVAQVFWQFLQELLLQTLYAFEESFFQLCLGSECKMLAQQQQRQFRVTNASEELLRRFLCPISRHVRSAVGENAFVDIHNSNFEYDAVFGTWKRFFLAWFMAFCFAFAFFSCCSAPQAVLET